MLKRSPDQYRWGFTLIEMILYIALFVIGSVLLVGILEGGLRIQGRETAVVEVSGQADLVMQTTRRVTEGASLIEEASSSLRVRPKETSKDPTLIYQSGGVVYLKEGSGAATALTDSSVVVDSLSFTKFSNPPAKDTVLVQLTLSFNTSNPGSEFTKTFRSSIARAVAATFDSAISPSTDNTIDVGASGTRWRDGFFSRDLTVNEDMFVDTNTFVVDATNNRVGIGTLAPSSSLHVPTGYLQIPASNGAPTSTDCDAAAELGRMIFDYSNNRIYVCDGTSNWKSATTT